MKMNSKRQINREILGIFKDKELDRSVWEKVLNKLVNYVYEREKRIKCVSIQSTDAVSD
jgi:hypothetical protein